MLSKRIADYLDNQRYNVKVNILKDKEEENKVPEKSKDRLEVLDKIAEYELNGTFDIDPEKDPPTIALTQGQVDFLRKKYLSKVKTKVAYSFAKQFLEDLLKNNKLIIKDIIGLENFDNVETGAIITCNHFNPFDCFTIEKVFRETKQYKNKKNLYKVIREGNYTNFPGFYGFLMRNCYTLPLSSNKKVMVEFLRAQDELLKNGDFVLIYPEQSLWWNYRKPKPLKDGAYKIAIRNNVPIIPIFITMQDSDIIGEDGFYIQEYTVNISKPIYANNDLSDKENTYNMRIQNYKAWKDIYESFYKKPLEYTTKEEVAKTIEEFQV